MSASEDYVQILTNLTRSLPGVDRLISGGAYIVGAVFLCISLGKFRKVGDARVNGGSNERIFIPFLYLIVGTLFIFLPSMLSVLSNTLFGVNNNVLQYMPYNTFNYYDAMKVLLRTVGILWFIRGSVLLVHASDPGVKDGPKGLLFLISGVLLMNFEDTYAMLNYIVTSILNLSMH